MIAPSELVGHTLLARDAAVPHRNTLLDDRAMVEVFSAEAGTAGLIAVDRVDRLRVKYRFGESLRAVYRVHVGARTWLVSGRTRPKGSETSGVTGASFESRGPLRGSWRSQALGCDFWTFPGDRRGSWAASLEASQELVGRVFPGRALSLEVRAVSPERAVIAGVMDVETGDTVAYLKVYRAGTLAGLQAKLDALRDAVTTLPVPFEPPRILGVSRASDSRQPAPSSDDAAGDALLVEPVSGTHLYALPTERLESTFRSLGQSLAALHNVPPPAWLPSVDGYGPAFRRAAQTLVCRARPELASVVQQLAAHLDASAPRPAAPVWVHGDLNARNWLAAGDRVHLIDFDQAGRGSAAADVGGVLAWMCTRTLEGHWSLDCEHRLQRALFAGYARVRPLPSRTDLIWFRSAALLVERAARAIGRYRSRQLACLPSILAAALSASDEREGLPDA